MQFCILASVLSSISLMMTR